MGDDVMRRWGSIGLAGVAVGVMSWAAADRVVEHNNEYDVSVVHGTESAPDEVDRATHRERSNPRQEEIVAPPTTAIDARDAEDRVDSVLAELRLKHEELVDAGAAAAAQTVHAQIQRLERAQRERAAVTE